MKGFRQLQVWAKAHRVTLLIYRLTAEFPVQERYGLTSQLRRASASVAANIAEGCGRNSDGGFHRFLVMAMGSAVEVEYFLLLARDLGYITDDFYREADRSVVEVQRMLGALVRKVDVARTSTRRQPLKANS